MKFPPQTFHQVSASTDNAAYIHPFIRAAVLNQDDSAPRRHLTTSEDILGVTAREGSATGIWGVEAREAAPLLAAPRTAPPQRGLAEAQGRSSS